jgi:signal transduction histidine kinase
VTGGLPAAERTLILARQGRDAAVARGILTEASIDCKICPDFGAMLGCIEEGADVAIVTEESMYDADRGSLLDWVANQPPWSDFPFIVLTRHGGGIERNPAAAELMKILGNVSFLERPFHPTTLVSVVQTGLRGRRRQYEFRRLNEELESRVLERTAELAEANRQLLAQIAERERVETTLRQMQRLEAVGQLTSGVAHDFNNLLTVVLGNIGFLEQGLANAGIDGKLAQRLGYMRAAAERGAKLTDQLLSFSRRQRLEPKAVDLNETVSGMRDLLQSTMGGAIHIETRLESGLWPALVDPTQIELAVLNLAINARDAMEIGGRLRVATENVTLGMPAAPEEPPPGEYVEIAVADNGSGMTAEVHAKALEPFFTTKEIGKGSGLGLSQVLGFAKQSGGGLRIESEPSRGTKVRIFLPRASHDIEAQREPPPPPQPDRVSGATILLVDDDDDVRGVTAQILREQGYRVLETGSGTTALEAVRRSADIDLLLVDVAMPA